MEIDGFEQMAGITTVLNISLFLEREASSFLSPRRLTELLTLEPFISTKFSILQSKPSAESAINSADLGQHSL